jgi:amino acid permease
MKDILNGGPGRLRLAVVVGTLVATLLTAAFGFAVLGVSGETTTENAIAGLSGIFGSWFMGLIVLFGFLAIATSYFTIGLHLQELFEYDYRFRRSSAWMFATGVPIVVFLMGAGSFTAIIGFSGAVFGGITAILVALLYVNIVRKKILPAESLGLPVSYAYLSIILLGFGAALQIARSFDRLLD